MTSAALAVEEVERLQARVSTLEQERKHLLAVIEILQDIGGSLHFAEIVRSVTLRLGETFGLDRCSIFLAERGGDSVRLVASYEDPGIRNLPWTSTATPSFAWRSRPDRPSSSPTPPPIPPSGRRAGPSRHGKVKAITVIPISWRGAAIGAIFLRTFRDGPLLGHHLEFCQVVANLTAKALRNAHRFERLRQRRGDDETLRRREGEQAAPAGLHAATARACAGGQPAPGRCPADPADSPEIERLVEVARRCSAKGVSLTVNASAADRAAWLRQQIERANDAYYVLQPRKSRTPVDSFFASCRSSSGQIPISSLPTPHQRVGAAVSGALAKHTHRRSMLSLANAFSLEELAESEERNARSSPEFAAPVTPSTQDRRRSGQPHLRGRPADGSTSRGNGVIGENITANIRTIADAPLAL